MNRFFHRLKAPILMVAIAVVGAASQSSQGAVDFGFFYSNLSPHGSWLVSAQYGRVWQPALYAPGWNPYYDGHWVYSDVGWTWVSDYGWGAVPYHYGTWANDPRLGWIWVPGYTWAPSWVVFRTGPDFIGWSPVAPGFSVGVSVGLGAPVAGSFVFVSCHDFLAPRIRTQVVPYSRTRVIINNTRIVNSLSVQNNIVVNRGPDVSVIERASGRRVQAVPIERVNRAAPGSRFSRAQIAIDSKRNGREVRAAEPLSARSPLPGPRPRATADRRRGAVRPTPRDFVPGGGRKRSEPRAALRTPESRNSSVIGRAAPTRRVSPSGAPPRDVAGRSGARSRDQGPDRRRPARGKVEKTPVRGGAHTR